MKEWGMCMGGKVGLDGRECGEGKSRRCDDGSNSVASSQTWCLLVFLGVNVDRKQVPFRRWRGATNKNAKMLLHLRSSLVFMWVIFEKSRTSFT